MAKNESHYGCPVCGAEISEKEYRAGNTTCNDENCENYGEPLEKLEFCAACEEYYSADMAERHSECG